MDDFKAGAILLNLFEAGWLNTDSTSLLPRPHSPVNLKSRSHSVHPQ